MGVCMCVFIYIYIYRERERERKREIIIISIIMIIIIQLLLYMAIHGDMLQLWHIHNTTREMGGAPRNPAPRNHFLVQIVKPSGCHCTDALGGEKYGRVPTPLRSTLSLTLAHKTGCLIAACGQGTLVRRCRAYRFANGCFDATRAQRKTTTRTTHGAKIGNSCNLIHMT